MAPILKRTRADMRFQNREDAGRKLASELEEYSADSCVVVALPRGGVPVGYEIARMLGAPLDVCVARKIGVPWYPELGLGAVAEGEHIDLSRRLVEQVGLSPEQLAAEVQRQRMEVAERVQRYRGDRPRLPLSGRTVILVDDGVATGGTVRAAIQSIRAEAPKSIVLAVPVASSQALEELAPLCDRIVCLLAPEDFYAVGVWYDDFKQISDQEVLSLLALSRPERVAPLQQRELR